MVALAFLCQLSHVSSSCSNVESQSLASWESCYSSISLFWWLLMKSPAGVKETSHLGARAAEKSERHDPRLDRRSSLHTRWMHITLAILGFGQNFHSAYQDFSKAKPENPKPLYSAAAGEADVALRGSLSHEPAIFIFRQSRCGH